MGGVIVGREASGHEAGCDSGDGPVKSTKVRSLPALAARAEWFDEAEAKSRLYRAHLPFSAPVHEDQGIIDIDRRRMIFRGEQGLTIDVAFRDIVDVYWGFDDTFKRRNEQYFGLFGKPLRITYAQEGRENTVYFFIGFELAGRRSQNRVWYQWLETLRPSHVKGEE